MSIDDPDGWKKDVAPHHIPSLRPRVEIVEVTEDTLNRFIREAMREDAERAEREKSKTVITLPAA